ncbi:MAG: FISUMP domain-containing protein [Bacteroidota bacterium]|nr:FISUMP domain-containing protein [Bacteroidota bacterium]
MIILLLTFWRCEKYTNTSPQADFSILPKIGDSLTVFIFDANSSTDQETGKWQLKLRWDIDDDGIWDNEYVIQKKYQWRFDSNGLKYIKLEVMDHEGKTHQTTKTLLVQPVIRDSIFTDERDEQIYKAIEIYGQWWMAENLNYGFTLSPNQFPKDNDVVENYQYQGQPPSDNTYGSFYTWNEATYYLKNDSSGICPQGWRLPVIDDIYHINNLMWFGSRYKEFLGESGTFGIDIQTGGKYYYSSVIWDNQRIAGNFWINGNERFDHFSSWARYTTEAGLVTISDYDPFAAKTVNWREAWGPFTFKKIALPIRCVKE